MNADPENTHKGTKIILFPEDVDRLLEVIREEKDSRALATEADLPAADQIALTYGDADLALMGFDIWKGSVILSDWQDLHNTNNSLLSAS
jgi:hypothetical protein